jgi:hypothetical protein
MLLPPDDPRLRRAYFEMLTWAIPGMLFAGVILYIALTLG